MLQADRSASPPPRHTAQDTRSASPGESRGPLPFPNDVQETQLSERNPLPQNDPLLWFGLKMDGKESAHFVYKSPQRHWQVCQDAQVRLLWLEVRDFQRDFSPCCAWLWNQSPPLGGSGRILSLAPALTAGKPPDSPLTVAREGPPPTTFLGLLDEQPPLRLWL